MKALISIYTPALLFSPQAMAGEGASCHFHGGKTATEGVFKGCADQRRTSRVKTGMLDASWTATKQEAVQLTDGKKGQERMVRDSTTRLRLTKPSKRCASFSRRRATSPGSER